MIPLLRKIKSATTDDDIILALKQAYAKGFKRGQQWPGLEGMGLYEEITGSFDDDILNENE